MNEQAQQQQQPDKEPDVVTQLQTCLDQLATQLYASLRYVTTRHPLSAPIDPLALPPTQTTAASTSFNTLNSTPNGAAASFPTSATPPSTYQSQASATGPRPAQSSSQPQASGSSSAAATAAFLQRYPRFTDPLQNPNDPSDTGEDAQNKIDPVSPEHRPLAVPEFQAAVRELAQDLVAKQKQIEGLIGLLPENGGEGTEMERQEARLKELEVELEGLRGSVQEAQGRKEKMLDRVDEVVACWMNGRV